MSVIRKSIEVSLQRSLRPLMSGQCIMDQLGRKSDLCVKEGLYLSYNRSAGKVDISIDQPKFEEQGWKTYDKLFFEHSDTCPSKHFRER
jgi:hypothetical protein